MGNNEISLRVFPHTCTHLCFGSIVKKTKRKNSSCKWRVLDIEDIDKENQSQT